MKEEKCKEELKEQAEEVTVQPIDDRNISDIVGGGNPFIDLPHIKNEPIDASVTENG